MSKHLRPIFRAVSFLVLCSCLGAPIFADGPPRLTAAAQGPVGLESVPSSSAADLWRSLGKAYSFEVVFAPKFRDQNVSVKAEGATLGEVLDRLAVAGDHFWTPLDEDTVIVATDTPQSRRQYEPQVVRVFRLENTEVADVMTTLRSLYGLKHIAADETRRTLTVRDTAAKVELAARLLEKIDVPADEVAVDVELLARAGEGAPARTVLRGDLSVVGRRAAEMMLEEGDPKRGKRVRVALEMEARVHPEHREVTLHLESSLAEQRGEGEADRRQSSSSRRVASGERLEIELPGRLGSDEILSLALTPTILRTAPAESDPTLWVGTEGTVLRPEGTREPPKELLQRLEERKRERERDATATEN